MTSAEQDPHDVAVIGGGAAGLSAALVLGRARRRVLVVDGASPRNRPAASMHGYLSRDGMPPADLLECGYQELRRYGVEVHRGTVNTLRQEQEGFQVGLSDAGSVRARRLLLSTGARDVLRP